MDPQQAKQHFEVHYYQWALADAQREVAEDFPLVSTIKGSLAFRFLAMMRSRRQEQQLELATALAKRFHGNALKTTGERMSSREEGLCRDYMTAITRPTPYEQGVYNQQAPGSQQYRIDRRSFAAALREELASILGEVSERVGRNEWRHQRQLDDWSVNTLIDVGGRYHQLTYQHSVRSSSPVPLQEWISVLSWLGIAGQSSWDLLESDEDVDAAVKSLALVCSHFMQALPGLLDGLADS